MISKEVSDDSPRFLAYSEGNGKAEKVYVAALAINQCQHNMRPSRNEVHTQKALPYTTISLACTPQHSEHRLQNGIVQQSCIGGRVDFEVETVNRIRVHRSGTPK